MSAVIKGLGVVWSVGDIQYTGGIVSGNPNTAAAVQSLRVARTSEKTIIKDNGGVAKAAVFHGFMQTLSLTVVPTGSSIANAKTSASAHMIDAVAGGTTSIVGRTVTIVDADGTVVDGTYNCISATQNRTVDGVATVDLELEKGDESNDITTLIS